MKLYFDSMISHNWMNCFGTYCLFVFTIPFGISNILARARRKQMKQILKKEKEKGGERERE